MLKRAGEIKIPVLEFKDATLAEALEFLRIEAVKRDPKQGGIQIISELKPVRMMTAKSMGPPGGWPIVNPLDARLTISQRNISLAEALRSVTRLTHCKFEPTITGFSIVLPTISVDPKITRTIPLPEAIFGKSANPEKAGVNRATIAEMRADLKQCFIDSGVNFPEGTSCAFADDGMTIIVTNTRDQTDLVQVLLEALVQPPKTKKKGKKQQ